MALAAISIIWQYHLRHVYYTKVIWQRRGYDNEIREKILEDPRQNHLKNLKLNWDNSQTSMERGKDTDVLNKTSIKGRPKLNTQPHPLPFLSGKQPRPHIVQPKLENGRTCMVSPGTKRNSALAYPNRAGFGHATICQHVICTRNASTCWTRCTPILKSPVQVRSTSTTAYIPKRAVQRICPLAHTT